MKIKKYKTEIGKQLLLNGKYYPTHTSGSGRFIHNYKSAYDLSTLGLKKGVHFVEGNDAPRGGACGEFQQLTAAGRRLKVIKDLFAKIKKEEEN